MKSPNPVWLLLAIGLALRLVYIGMPLVEDNTWIRQTQTAAAIQYSAENGIIPPYTIASWRGDQEAKLAHEFPLYNWLAVPLARLIGVDPAARLVSALLWAGSFLLLQGIWTRCLTDRQTFWANLLYVFSPLGIALGQAVLPEMLVCFLSIAFIAAFLQYLETDRWSDLILCTVAGVLACIVKLPAVSHLYFLFLFFLFKKESFDFLKRPRYWLFLFLTLIPIKLWADYTNVVNAEHFAFWSASSNLREFLGNFDVLIRPRSWMVVGGYLAAFVMTPVGIALAALGILKICKDKIWTFFPLIWLASLAIFYCLWGPRTAFGHAYYNLPALGPLAGLGGVGVVTLLDWARTKKRIGFFVRYACLIGFVAFAVFGTFYMMRPEWTAYRAAEWLKANTKETDRILVKANHREYTVNYSQFVPVAYYSGRKTWIWTWPGPDAELGLANSEYFLELHPAPRSENPLLRWQEKFKGAKFTPEDMGWLTAQPNLSRIESNPEFSVWRVEGDVGRKVGR